MYIIINYIYIKWFTINCYSINYSFRWSNFGIFTI